MGKGGSGAMPAPQGGTTLASQLQAPRPTTFDPTTVPGAAAITDPVKRGAAITSSPQYKAHQQWQLVPHEFRAQIEEQEAAGIPVKWWRGNGPDPTRAPAAAPGSAAGQNAAAAAAPLATHPASAAYAAHFGQLPGPRK